MQTAAYNICYNEIDKVSQWIEKTKLFDYRVVLDTGSTDGSYEFLQNVPNIILQQKRDEPFRFDAHRNYCLQMVPENVEWCVSVDFDEYYSENVIDIISSVPKEMNVISCDRIELSNNSKRVGYPNHLPFNRIHRRNDFLWNHPVYECLNHKGYEYEYYSKELVLYHDQQLTKPRNDFYLEIMQRQYKNDKTDCWNNWFLLNHYYRERNLEGFIAVATDFINFNKEKDERYYLVKQNLEMLFPIGNKKG